MSLDDPLGAMARVHVFITGKVQGVYFRDSTRQQALELGVAGWVRNLPDGRVEAVFEGPRKAVDDLVRWCKRGPPAAHVEDLEVKREDEEEGLTAFEVRPTPRR